MSKSGIDFKIPPEVCTYISNIVPYVKNQKILEPSMGNDDLLDILKHKGIVTKPDNFLTHVHTSKYDWIVMNPPMSPMKMSYEILDKCMLLSDNIVALMPWLTIINGDKRTNKIMRYGLKSITHLPRNTFAGSRIQTCILHLEKGYKGDTIFKTL